MRPQNPIRYSQIKEWKADATVKGKGKGKGGGKVGGKGNGKWGADEEVRKLKANTKRLEEEVRKLKQVKKEADDDEDGSEEEDEEMDAELKTKSDWERAVAEAEADGKHAERMLKTYPTSAKYLSRVEEAKTGAEDARERLQELRDPADQLRH